ncbi:MAG: hypothetical protein RLZZ628_3855 [Bacteroidota bacterium]|jgi:uncharacterized protein (DUF1800 family)
MSLTAISETESVRVARVSSGLTPYSGVFDRDRLIHLLKRTLFGAAKADIDFFAGMTLDAVVTALTTPNAAEPAPPLKNYTGLSNAVDMEPEIAQGKTWVDFGEIPAIDGQRRTNLKTWWLGVMLNQERNVHEKMTLFWHNHFSTEVTGLTALMGYNHYKMLRRNALGNFKTFVKEVTLDPLMLYYLNGRLNGKAAPDENYGRELQELFCIGKSQVTPWYTEEDVKAAAKVLTGFRVKPQTLTGTSPNRTATPMGYTFDATQHDTTNKTFSAFYGNRVITGQTGANGALELDGMLDMIFANREVAAHICRKLYRWFVYYEIDAATELNVIQPLADIFRTNNYDIRPVLKALFSSEHFFDPANYGCVIKSPADFVIGLAREFDIAFPPATDLVAQYTAWLYLAGLSNNGNVIGLAKLEQDLGDPPNVSGWTAYYQAPQFHEQWINTDTYPKRERLVDSMLTTAGYALGGGKKIVIDPVKFTAAFGARAADPNFLIADALQILYRVPQIQRFTDYLKSILLSNQSSDHYWMDAWNAYLAAPTNTTALNAVTTRLTAFYKAIVNQPDYHLS